MKIIPRLLATVSLPIALAGCELITDVEFVGSLSSLSNAQINELIDSDNFPPPASANTSANVFSLDVSSDCSSADRDITVTIPATLAFGVATGSLTIDNDTYTITRVACELPSFDDPAIEGVGYFVAEPDDPSLSVTPEVLVSITEFSADSSIAASGGFETFTGATSVTLRPLLGNSVTSVTNDDITLAAIFVPEPVMNDPETLGRQILAQAAVDLDALITDEYSYTNWILSGALFALERAADEKNWQDDNTLNDRRGSSTYATVAIAVNEIERIADWTDDGALMASLDAITSSILDGMRTIATDRIALATENGGNVFKLDRANYRLQEGDIERSQDHLRSAVNRFGGAWKAATSAIR